MIEVGSKPLPSEVRRAFIDTAWKRRQVLARRRDRAAFDEYVARQYARCDAGTAANAERCRLAYPRLAAISAK